jgi:hypothetical protein
LRSTGIRAVAIADVVGGLPRPVTGRIAAARALLLTMIGDYRREEPIRPGGHVVVDPRRRGVRTVGAR